MQQILILNTVDRNLHGLIVEFTYGVDEKRIGDDKHLNPYTTVMQAIEFGWRLMGSPVKNPDTLDYEWWLEK